MQMQTRTITLSSRHHYGRRVPPRQIGELLRTLPAITRQSVRMAVEGRSQAKGKPPRWLTASSDIRFVDHGGDDDTILYFEAPTLGEAASALYEQHELWPTRPDPEDTAFDLLGDVVQDIAEQNRDSERYDRPLLRTFQELSRGFDRSFDECRIVGRRQPENRPAIVNEAVFERAAALNRATPRSRQIRVSGVLDMIRASTSALGVIVDGGAELRGVLTSGDVTEITGLLKQRVLLLGKAVFRPSGNLLRIDVAEIRAAQEGDSFFTAPPEPVRESVDQRALLREARSKRGVAAIVGQWPGDESDEQIEAALREMS